MRFLLGFLVLPAVAVLIAGCGSEDTDPGSDVPDTGLTAVKSYLTDHTADLADAATRIEAAAETYYGLAKSNGFNYRKLMKQDCKAVGAALGDARNAYIRANPYYEEMEAIIAGIPRMAQYHTDIDGGTDASVPENAVSFNLKLRDGTVLKQPGSLFFLLETSLFGTNDELVVEGVKPDLDCDGKARFGEGLPEAATLRSVAGEFSRQADDLDADAQEIVISESDAFTVVAIVTPTMDSFFDQWKRSSFVAGQGRQEEPAFVATSRLSDIADVLTGVSFTYDEIRPLIAAEDEDRAEVIAAGIDDLLARAENLRDREAAGEKFTSTEAEDLGAEMQLRAERIADQVTRAAADAGIEIQES